MHPQCNNEVIEQLIFSLGHMKVLQSKGTLLSMVGSVGKLAAGMTKYFHSRLEDISYLARWGLNNRAVLLVQ